MMSLPVFTEPYPTKMWLFDEQLRLQRQANKMMSSTGIMDLLSNYGEFSGIEGSYKYSTMIYPDLDVGVLSPSADKQYFAHMLSDIGSQKYVRRISGVDTADFATLRHKRPKGYWLGIEIPFEGDRWGIDCWLQRPEWVDGSGQDYTEDLKDIDEEQRYAILAIKYDLIRLGKYGKDYLSIDVYDAVLEANVRTVEQFYSSR